MRIGESQADKVTFTTPETVKRWLQFSPKANALVPAPPFASHEATGRRHGSENSVSAYKARQAAAWQHQFAKIIFDRQTPFLPQLGTVIGVMLS